MLHAFYLHFVVIIEWNLKIVNGSGSLWVWDWWFMMASSPCPVCEKGLWTSVNACLLPNVLAAIALNEYCSLHHQWNVKTQALHAMCLITYNLSSGELEIRDRIWHEYFREVKRIYIPKFMILWVTLRNIRNTAIHLETSNQSLQCPKCLWIHG